MKIIEINSLQGLAQVAQTILDELNGRTVVLFRAPMGAGKTTLIREIVAKAGSEDCVTSPTFAIVNDYMISDDESIYHFDMYRITKIEEALDLGFEEYLSSGNISLIEWPENIEALLPDDAMTVEIEVGDEEQRTFKIY
ncbi:MAG: tRNA (adenosine(37)-N6)-threonylcarbamoyltransferase complex ATPase subunit type 1 TsaE [Rikenellaceae bacterium]